MKNFDPKEYLKSQSDFSIVIQVNNGMVEEVITKDDQCYLILDCDEYIEHPQCPICEKELDDNYCCSVCEFDFTNVLMP